MSTYISSDPVTLIAEIRRLVLLLNDSSSYEWSWFSDLLWVFRFLANPHTHVKILLYLSEDRAMPGSNSSAVWCPIYHGRDVHYISTFFRGLGNIFFWSIDTFSNIFFWFTPWHSEWEKKHAARNIQKLMISFFAKYDLFADLLLWFPDIGK